LSPSVESICIQTDEDIDSPVISMTPPNASDTELNDVVWERDGRIRELEARIRELEGIVARKDEGVDMRIVEMTDEILELKRDNLMGIEELEKFKVELKQADERLENIMSEFASVNQHVEKEYKEHGGEVESSPTRMLLLDERIAELEGLLEKERGDVEGLRVLLEFEEPRVKELETQLSKVKGQFEDLKEELKESRVRVDEGEARRVELEWMFATG
jgi:chromosome segregation ATPase